MNVFYVFFPATNSWRVWEGMEKTTVEVLAAEFGAHTFKTYAEWNATQKPIVG